MPDMGLLVVTIYAVGRHPKPGLHATTQSLTHVDYLPENNRTAKNGPGQIWTLTRAAAPQFGALSPGLVRGANVAPVLTAHFGRSRHGALLGWVRLEGREDGDANLRVASSQSTGEAAWERAQCFFASLQRTLAASSDTWRLQFAGMCCQPMTGHRSRVALWLRENECVSSL